MVFTPKQKEMDKPIVICAEKTLRINAMAKNDIFFGLSTSVSVGVKITIAAPFIVDVTVGASWKFAATLKASHVSYATNICETESSRTMQAVNNSLVTVKTIGEDIQNKAAEYANMVTVVDSAVTRDEVYDLADAMVTETKNTLATKRQEAVTNLNEVLETLDQVMTTSRTVGTRSAFTANCAKYQCASMKTVADSMTTVVNMLEQSADIATINAALISR